LVSLEVQAKLDFEDHAFPEFVTSARALAMGNAFICKVDDSMSAFYNPAGLGTVRRPSFHLFNANLEGSNGLFKTVGGGPAYQFPSNYSKTFDVNTLRESLAQNQGVLLHSRGSAFPNFTVRGLTLGYMFSQRNRAIINDDVANEFEVAERLDHGPVMALNGSFFGGILKLGASATYLHRKELYKVAGPSDQLNLVDSDFKQGRSLQVTAGTRITLPFDLLPTISAVLRNATNNNFEAPDLGGLPDRVKQTFDIGFSITPQISKVSRLHTEINLKDVGNSYDTDTKRRIAAGVEYDLKRRLFLRAGYGDGWGSAGLGVKARTFSLDLTTYAVDRSLDGFRKEEDRRWVLSFSSGL